MGRVRAELCPNAKMPTGRRLAHACMHVMRARNRTRNRHIILTPTSLKQLRILAGQIALDGAPGDGLDPPMHDELDVCTSSQASPKGCVKACARSGCPCVLASCVLRTCSTQVRCIRSVRNYTAEYCDPSVSGSAMVRRASGGNDSSRESEQCPPTNAAMMRGCCPSLMPQSRNVPNRSTSAVKYQGVGGRT